MESCEQHLNSKDISTGSKDKYKIAITVLALISLVTAYAAGIILERHKSVNFILNHFPGRKVLKVGGSPPVYEVKSSQSRKGDLMLLLTGSDGWGGPLKIATAISQDGKIEEILVLDHKETPSFLKSLRDEGFFKQFRNKPVSNQFVPGTDIDAVSGATISSVAFAKAIREGAHWFARHRLHQDIEEPQASGWEISANVLVLLALYLTVFFK